MKLKVIACKWEKDCKNPYGCCSYCDNSGCNNEDEQCPEVPDTCADSNKIME